MRLSVITALAALLRGHSIGPKAVTQPPYAMPAQAILQAHPDYATQVAAHRRHARRLQERAFKVTPATLADYVAKHLVIEGDYLSMVHGPRGAIFASPHYGPFLGAALLFANVGSVERPAHVFYDPADQVPENARFDTLFARFAPHLEVLHNQAADLIRAARALRNRQCVSIMFDVVQDPLECTYVPFFERLYPAMGGSAYLSLLSGAPVIPTYCSPDSSSRVRITFGQTLQPTDYRQATREQRVYAMTCDLFGDFERQLLKAPWHWIYWGNVKQTAAFSEAMIATPTALLAHLREVVNAAPQLAKIAPVLAQPSCLPLAADLSEASS